ncbi:MAG: Ig-like domain-containing protein, partial [Thermoplasmata archaeon]|nr:Ig-like domain-containing protein [Thermoplasmata archaeon]
ITVEVENTGNEYLTDIVVTCKIYSDAGLTTEVADLLTNGTTSMDPDEVMSFGFDTSWTPKVDDPLVANSFWVNITATGTGFQDIVNIDTYPATEVIIQNMTAIAWVSMDDYGTLGTIMTPYPYINETQPFVKGYTYLNGVNTVQFNIKNVGNIETDVTINASYYADPVFPEPVETDNDQATVLALAAGTESGWTDFTTTWDLTGLFDGLLNLSIASGSDVPIMNTSHYFWVQNLEDVMPMDLTTDLIDKFGTTTFNTTATHDFSVDIVNNGNQLINSDFYARLNATEWSAGAFGTESDFGYQMIDGATTNLNPGDASAEVWAGIAPPGPGPYQFNVTAPGKDPATNFPNDYNATNNQTSILLTFQDTEGLSLVLTSPTDDSKWPVMDMDINATVTNMGTLDFWDLGGGQVSLIIYDNNDTTDTIDDVEVWTPANVTIPGLEMTMDTWADWTWTGAVGGEEYLVVVNATAGATTVGQAVTITFPHPNGSVSGMILTPATTAGIEVKAMDGTTEIAMTTTDATGSYQMSLEAILTAYNITVTAPYGYEDAYNDTVMVLDDGRDTFVNFDLVKIPRGIANGTITLVEVGTPASPTVDYKKIEIAVDGTTLWVNADADGNYSIPEIVPDVVNVTATMTGFTSAWNESVTIVADEVTMYVNFTLTEDWDVTVVPAHEAEEVLVDAVVTVTFEEEINVTSVNLTDSFEVEDDTATTVDGAIAWATGNMSFTFTPDANLTADTVYSVWLSTDITNLTDVEVLHRDWESTFETEVGILNGTVSGWVLDAWNGNPIAGATVSVGPVSTVSDTDGTYSLDLVAGAVTVGASKALYVADSADATVVAGADTPEINLSLTPDVKIDVSVMVDGTSTDLTPDGTRTTGVDVDTAITLEFEEAINETSMEVTLADGGSVLGATEWNATTNIVTFTPDADLEGETNYTITITDALINATADAMLPRDIDWMFMTGLGVPPTVTATITPADGTDNVALDEAVTIAFNYEMNANLTEAAITAAFGT